MLNKKGFTIAEVIVSFSLVAMLLLSIITSTVIYRDKLKKEIVISQLIDFKNNITKIIYDDIIAGRVEKVTSCGTGIENCLNLVGPDNSSHVLRIHEVYNSDSSGLSRGVYLFYDNRAYMLPDSDLAGEDDYHNIIRICNFINGLNYTKYENMYTIKISFLHRDYEVQKDIIITMFESK